MGHPHSYQGKSGSGTRFGGSSMSAPDDLQAALTTLRGGDSPGLWFYRWTYARAGGPRGDYQRRLEAADYKWWHLSPRARESWEAKAAEEDLRVHGGVHSAEFVRHQRRAPL